MSKWTRRNKNHTRKKEEASKEMKRTRKHYHSIETLAISWHKLSSFCPPRERLTLLLLVGPTWEGKGRVQILWWTWYMQLRWLNEVELTSWDRVMPRWQLAWIESIRHSRVIPPVSEKRGKEKGEPTYEIGVNYFSVGISFFGSVPSDVMQPHLFEYRGLSCRQENPSVNINWIVEWN